MCHGDVVLAAADNVAWHCIKPYTVSVSVPVIAGDAVTGLLLLLASGLLLAPGLLVLLTLASGLLPAPSTAAAESGAERGAKDTAAADVTAEYKACTAQQPLQLTVRAKLKRPAMSSC